MSTLKASHPKAAAGQGRRDSHRPVVKRGRPPKKAFINVLVRTSTRSALTQMKASIGLPSQGEVIDYLVERVQGQSLAKQTPSS